MSVQSAHDFLRKARQDAGLRQQLEGLRANGKDATIAAIVRLAAQAGFTFTGEEYEAAVQEELARQHAAQELADEQLARVAAAGSNAISCTPGARDVCSPVVQE